MSRSARSALTIMALAVLLCMPRTDAAAQQTGILRIRVTIVDAEQQTRPVPRHLLLISQNPTSAAPQPAVTGADGTAQVYLRPGNYTVESDQPLIFQGKSYEWSQTLDISAGQTSTLELTAGNAQVEAAAARQPSGSNAAPAEGSASALLLDWQSSVVTIWSPTRRGAGFLIDARGLIATNQRLAATEKILEVQLSATEKVAARVLTADPDKNVAILWIDPKAVASMRPVKPGYSDAGQPLADKQKIFAISWPMDDERTISSGTVSRITARTVLSNLRVDDDSLGAPVFNAAGEVIAITVPEDDTSGSGSGATHAVRIDEMRGAVAAAEKKMASTDAPDAARLPVEPRLEIGVDALKEAAEMRKGAVAPYRVAAADFDVSLITPVLVYGARHRSERTPERARPRSARDVMENEAARRSLQDFGNWWDYVRQDPPVLMVRATPKLVGSFWSNVLRGAAQTQGVSLPPIQRIKAGFSRLRIFCGDAEVAPIHPFKIEHRIGAADAVYEGLYVFDPAAIGPHCASVKLTLFSDKAPDKGDMRVIDPKILQQIREDFAPYRAARQ